MVVAAVEVASAQLRAALIDTEFALDRNQPDRRPPLVNLKGYSWDLDALSVDEVVERVAAIVREVSNGRESEIEGVGVAYRAAIDPLGRIVPTHDRQARVRADFVRPLQKLLQRAPFSPGLAVVAGNRSNMGAWGEYRVGNGWFFDEPSLVYVTVERFLGAGIVIGGRLFLGATRFAGEIGHIQLDPTSTLGCPSCLQVGCASLLATGYALLREVEPYMSTGGAQIRDSFSALREEEQAQIDSGAYLDVPEVGGIHRISARAVMDVVDATAPESMLPAVPEALQAAKTVARYLGMSIAQVISIVNPKVVALGGIAPASQKFVTMTMEAAETATPPSVWDGIHFDASLLDDTGPLYGAAHWVKDRATCALA